MNKSFAFQYRRNQIRTFALLGTFIAAGAHADGAVVGWVEKPDVNAVTIFRGGNPLPKGQADLQACDIVQLDNHLATVRITLSGQLRLKLDSQVPEHKIQVACEEKPIWEGRTFAIVRAIAGLATAPTRSPETGVYSRTLDQSRPLAVPALGNYDPMLVAGERALYVNRTFTSRILGVDEAESRELLRYLTNRVKAPEYQVRFHWSPNAIVFWDNRPTQHYAVLDYWPHHRVVERVTIVGDKPV